MSEPLCMHVDLWGVVATCGCKVVPSSPPARSRDEAEKAIAAVLAEHEYWEPTEIIKGMCRGHSPVVTFDSSSWDDCWAEYVAHIAPVLADLMADAPTLADARCCRPKDHPGECYPLADPLCDRVPADTEGNQ